MEQQYRSFPTGVYEEILRHIQEPEQISTMRRLEKNTKFIPEIIYKQRYNETRSDRIYREYLNNYDNPDAYWYFLEYMRVKYPEPTEQDVINELNMLDFCHYMYLFISIQIIEKKVDDIVRQYYPTPYQNRLTPEETVSLYYDLTNMQNAVFVSYDTYQKLLETGDLNIIQRRVQSSIIIVPDVIKSLFTSNRTSWKYSNILKSYMVRGGSLGSRLRFMLINIYYYGGSGYKRILGSLLIQLRISQNLDLSDTLEEICRAVNTLQRSKQYSSV